MKGLILIARGFEEAEAIITIDLIRRAKIQIDLVSMEKDLQVSSSHNLLLGCDYKFSQIKLKDYDFLVIPGGKAVFDNLINNLTVKSIVDYFMMQEKLIACICAAPMILGKYQYLNDKKYICFPGCESEAFNGNLTDAGAITDGNIITSKACGKTFEFAYEIIKYLLGEAKAQEIIASVYYQFPTK